MGDSLEISRTPGNDRTEIQMVIRSGQRVPDVSSERGLITFGSDSPAAAEISAHVDEESHLQVYVATDDPSVMSKMTTTSAMQISSKKIGNIPVPIASPSSVAEALRECENQKSGEWGIDLATWRALTSRPMPVKPLSVRLNTLDYPAAALADGIEADTIIRLDINNVGRVTGCSSPMPSENRGFEQAACSVLRGARFRPGVDSEGQPVSAPYLYNVKFRIAR